MLQWSWNGELDKDRIREVILQCKEQGFGGFFTHIRPGLTTPYLSEEWFDFWDYAARLCAEEGLEWHIYDEYTAGGGAAGGHTIATMPNAVQRELAVVPVVDPSQVVDALAYYSIDRESRETQSLGPDELAETLERGEEVVAVVYQIAPGGRRRNGLGPIDLYHPDTAPAFIETTHAKYAQRSGDLFGSTVNFCFNDEPHTNQSKTAYPFSEYISKEFRKDHGYDLENKLESLLFWKEDTPETRYDFYRTLDRLYNLQFVKPLHDWCGERKLEFTGHFMEHEWPRPISQPNSMAALRWMQAPGNDLLGFQFEATSLDDNDIYFLNLKELSSLANQYDKRNVMVESCGAGGWDQSFPLFKTCEDFLLAFGINVMDPHLSHYSVAGARKYDFAQSLSDHSAWWPRYRPQADHVGRVIAMQREAEEVNRVLALHPTTTGWLYYEPRGYPWADSPSQQRLDAMRETHAAGMRVLYQNQIDFDLGDEILMEESGTVAGGALRVGSRRYQAVALPQDLETLSAKNCDLLERYLEAGGKVWQVGDNWNRIDGRVSDRPEELRRKYEDSWIRVESWQALAEELRQAVRPYLSGEDGKALVGDPVWRRSELPDGSVLLFICNPWEAPLQETVAIEGNRAVELDTASGQAQDLETREVGGRLVFDLDLPPRGHVFLLLSRSPVEARARLKREVAGECASALKSVRAEGENLLNIDFCDFEANGREVKDVPAPRADQLNWNWQGFACSPWLMTGGGKPFAGDIYRTRIDPDSSLKATYRFLVEAGVSDEVLASVSLGVERPRLWKISINGEELDSNLAKPWLDPSAGRFEVGAYLQRGDNVVELSAAPFNVLNEVAPIYLIGDFSANPASRGFSLGQPSELAPGDWTQQGRPFFDGLVTYRFEVEVKQPASGLRVEASDWRGSLVSAAWDGQRVGEIYHPPYQLDFAVDAYPGRHDLDLTVYGITQNKFGPYFTDRKVHVVASWLHGPAHMPPGQEYRFKPSGLMSEALKVWTMREL